MTGVASKRKGLQQALGPTMKRHTDYTGVTQPRSPASAYEWSRERNADAKGCAEAVCPYSRARTAVSATVGADCGARRTAQGRSAATRAHRPRPKSRCCAD